MEKIRYFIIYYKADGEHHSHHLQQQGYPNKMEVIERIGKQSMPKGAHTQITGIQDLTKDDYEAFIA